MPSIDEIEKIIKESKTLTSRQWALVIVITIMCVGAAFWVENRYAKIEEINNKFQKNQQQLDSAHFLALEMFGLLSESQRRKIMEKINLSDHSNSVK